MVPSLIKNVSLLGPTSLTTAIPISTLGYPPTLITQSFNFIVNVTSSDLTPRFDNHVLTSYHVGAGEAYAVLIENTTFVSARTLYVNGTAEEVWYNAGVLFDGRTPVRFTNSQCFVQSKKFGKCSHSMKVFSTTSLWRCYDLELSISGGGYAGELHWNHVVTSICWWWRCWSCIW